MSGERISLTFICVRCGRTRLISVPKERGIRPGRYPWVCIDCQGKWPVAFGAGRRVETTRQEGK